MAAGKGRAAASLPTFIEPMLVLLAPPFDSDRHLYEIKWDGFRSLCFAEHRGHRLVGRNRTDFTARFPELKTLAALPNGTLLDGEIVQLTDGRPDFGALLSRQRTWSSRSPGRFSPVTFVAFDLLYQKHKPLLDLPLVERRERLSAVLKKASVPHLIESEGHVGGGITFFEQAARLGLEGVVAKRLDGRYEPGERSGSWMKFKKRQSIVCAIIGYEPNSTNGIKSLLLAAEVEGEARFVGQVGSGLDVKANNQLLRDFQKLQRPSPPIPCTIKAARWLEPALYCRVSFAEWTAGGKLRAPVFESLL